MARRAATTTRVDRDELLAFVRQAWTRKVTNLRRDPRASALVLSDDVDGPWVRVDGTAEVVDLPELVD